MAKSVQLVADTGDDAAALDHCHSGKDRTGWMTAILLSILGTNQDVIFDDYLSSNNYGAPPTRSGSPRLPLRAWMSI